MTDLANEGRYFPWQPIVKRYLNPVGTRVREAGAADPKVEQEPIYIDQFLYMTLGPGRYATLDNVPIVQEFFGYKPSFRDLPPGEYTLDEVLDRYGYQGTQNRQKQLRFTQKQYKIDPKSPDYVDRVLAWGSTACRLKGLADPASPLSNQPEVRFVVNPDGRKYITNGRLHPLQDNFDLKSDDRLTQFANNRYLRPEIDPLGIGVRIPFILTGDGPLIKNFTRKDYEVAKIQTARQNPAAILYPQFLYEMKNAVESEIRSWKNTP